MELKKDYVIEGVVLKEGTEIEIIDERTMMADVKEMPLSMIFKNKINEPSDQIIKSLERHIYRCIDKLEKDVIGLSDERDYEYDMYDNCSPNVKKLKRAEKVSRYFFNAVRDLLDQTI